MKKTIYIILLVFLVTNVFAQTRKKKIRLKQKQKQKQILHCHHAQLYVTSAFQPSLKTTSKINFSAISPLPDTARPVLQYNVPAQNLMFSYQSPH
jgi:hypothetical protein